MEESVGSFVPCADDQWDEPFFNIFFCNNDFDLEQRGFLGQYPSSSSSHDNQVYFHSNPDQGFDDQYNYNNGGGRGEKNCCYFGQPQEKMNEQEEVCAMPVDVDINDFFMPDFSSNMLTNESNYLITLKENNEGRHADYYDAISVAAAVTQKSQLKRKSAAAADKSSTESNKVEDDDRSYAVTTAKNPKKKPRVSRPDHLQKTMKKKNVAETRRRRKQKDGDEGEITRPKEEGIEQISSVCCSSLDDDDTASNGNKAATMTGKAGAAMDPQSLYARKRRERINERLKILQNLVPNGTKVDISTMLEDAVLYVKFLQLQIKLLSSEDMWMYAPIAYNGMDIGRLGQIPPL